MRFSSQEYTALILAASRAKEIAGDEKAQRILESVIRKLSMSQARKGAFTSADRRASIRGRAA